MQNQEHLESLCCFAPFIERTGRIGFDERRTRDIATTMTRRMGLLDPEG